MHEDRMHEDRMLQEPLQRFQRVVKSPLKLNIRRGVKKVPKAHASP